MNATFLISNSETTLTQDHFFLQIHHSKTPISFPPQKKTWKDLSQFQRKSAHAPQKELPKRKL